MPYRFEYVDRQFSVSEHATTLAEVQLIEQPVTLSLTLWNRTQWVKSHPDLYTKDVQRCAERQTEAYRPSWSDFVPPCTIRSMERSRDALFPRTRSLSRQMSSSENGEITS